MGPLAKEGSAAGGPGSVGWASVRTALCPFVFSHLGRRTRTGNGASLLLTSTTGNPGPWGECGGRAVEGKGSRAKGWLGTPALLSQLYNSGCFLP